MRIIIAGSRTWTDYGEILSVMEHEVIPIVDVSEIVSGTAMGADRLGETWADQHNVPIKQFPALWWVHGRGAGFIRNEEMAEYADGLVLFWDGKSKGSANMLKHAEERNLLLWNIIKEACNGKAQQ